jgi:hypothetical protein
MPHTHWCRFDGPAGDERFHLEVMPFEGGWLAIVTDERRQPPCISYRLKEIKTLLEAKQAALRKAYNFSKHRAEFTLEYVFQFYTDQGWEQAEFCEWPNVSCGLRDAAGYRP